MCTSGCPSSQQTPSSPTRRASPVLLTTSQSAACTRSAVSSAPTPRLTSCTSGLHQPARCRAPAGQALQTNCALPSSGATCRLHPALSCGIRFRLNAPFKIPPQVVAKESAILMARCIAKVHVLQPTMLSNNETYSQIARKCHGSTAGMQLNAPLS